MSTRLLIPEKLYGRAREIEALIEAFDRVVKKARRLRRNSRNLGP